MPTNFAVRFDPDPPYETYVARFWNDARDTRRRVPARYWASLGKPTPRVDTPKLHQLAIAWAATKVAEIEAEWVSGPAAAATPARAFNLAELLDWYIERNPNDGGWATLAKYRDCKARLVAQLGEKTKPDAVDEDVAVGYRNAEQARGRRNRTIKGDLVFLKQVLTYGYQHRKKTGMRELGLLKLPKIAKQKSLRAPLTEDELRKVLRVRLPRDRDRIIRMIVFAVTTGDRKWPLLHFETAWLDRADRMQRIPGWAMKGGEERWGDEAFEVPVCDWALDVAITDRRHKWLFPNVRTGRPNGQIDRSLWRVAELAGVRYFSLQDLRNTFSSVLSDHGVHELLIKVLMGHAADSVTREYIKRHPAALRAAVGVWDTLRPHLDLGNSLASREACASHKPLSRKAG